MTASRCPRIEKIFVLRGRLFVRPCHLSSNNPWTADSCFPFRQVPPWMKLPAFYLLDAISKNVYEPYARVFASFVTPLFLETYHLVDQGTRNKMEEMLLTWRNGSPTGKEVFGIPTQVAIERGVWGNGGSVYQVRVSSRSHFTSNLFEFRHMLARRKLPKLKSSANSNLLLAIGNERTKQTPTTT